MWNYFIFFSLIFLIKTQSYVIQNNKTDQILYKRDDKVKLISDKIKKPDTDPSSYKLIELTNRLRVLLISNPDTLRSGAALDVKVGHYSDPDGIPGVAHFCEHLLFMGTKKYPGEDDFSGYLSTHSGSYNAYTGTEDTNYFFSIPHNYFEKALDIFSQFFISPLISERSVEREARVVDLEHRKNLQSDEWRLFQLEKSISSPKTPYHKFGTGNYKTLVEDTRKKNINIASIVSKFFQEHYSSNLMKLVLFSSKTLDELEKYAATYFSDVPDKNLERPKFTEEPFGKDVIGNQYWYKPIADKMTMELVFPITSQIHLYKTNPTLYLSYFLQHESPGSILYFLKRQGWVTSLSVVHEYIVSNTDNFRIGISLTSQGLDNYEDIIGLLFKFLKMLKDEGPQKTYFDELIQIDEIFFRFQDLPQLTSYVSDLARNMQDLYLDDVDILRNTYVSEYNSTHITQLLDQLRDDNYYLFISTKDRPDEWDKREPWYDSEYKVESFSSTLLEKTKNYTTKYKLKLPEKNVFISEKFITKNVSTNKTTKPVLLYSDAKLRYWYKEDDTFSTPKSSVFISFKIPDYSSSPYETAHSSVYVNMLFDYIYSTHYNAVAAGYHIRLLSRSYGIFLSLYGFSDKILVLFDEVVKSMAKFSPSNTSFEISKQRLVDSYVTKEYSMPFTYVAGTFPQLHNPFLWPSSDILYALNLMTYNDIYHFHSRRFSSIFYEVLVVGVVSYQTPYLFELYFRDLSSKVQYPYQVLPPRSFVIEEGSNYIYELALPNPLETNSAILYSLQFGSSKDPRLVAILNVIYTLIRSQLFDQLRTKEQLGYAIRSMFSSGDALLSFFFIIQSQRDPYYLEHRINAFLYKFAVFIDHLTDEELKGYIDSLITLTLPNYKDIYEESSTYMYTILTGFYDFDFNSKMIAVFKELTKDDIRNFYYAHFYPSAANRRKLSIHLKSQTLETVSVRDLSPKRLQYYFKCNGLVLSLDEIYNLIEAIPTLAEFEKEIEKLLKEKYPDKDVSTVVAQAFEYLRKLYQKLKEDTIKDYDAVHFTDIAVFKNSLKLSPAPLPILDWSKYKSKVV
ncbi:hypothetical protein T552_03303 [Pneumocystis carinii B80]|uniref:Uncharacterized protein n=1 Tax=Pneumocystis carinii (strain B80) TaxID=1408658 RepID=A0A0W4ZC90_PNEC8|nr:hypothetical protein T552_03303 [Pneumocystis carinii B80]KTW26034.1 hypothetical protein T552_03303 [Pneumocystis carinii B80]